MRRNSIMTACVGALAALALGSVDVWTKAQAQTNLPESYKVGFLMPLTGGSGKLGQMMLEGAQLALDEINGGAGINGRKIALIQEDSQGLAKNGIDGFRKLVDIDKTPVIITGWTAVSVATAPLATETKTFLISGSTASPAVRNVSPYFQSTWMFDDESVKLILPYARSKLSIAKLGILTIISDLGAGLSASIKADWKRLGGDEPLEESFQAQETNFRPTLLKMIAAKPDAIYITSSNGKQAAQIVRQARDLGYEGYFLSFGAFEDPEVLALGDKCGKCIYTAPAFDASNGSEQTKAFAAAFSKKFGRMPNVHHANHYDLIQMFKVVSERLAKDGKPFTGETFRAQLMSSMPVYDGAGGRYTFNFKDGSVLRSTLVKTVKGGAFVTIQALD